MAQWGSYSESGILRKNKPKDNHDDLLVFGYACKLFRDDDKASFVDKGHHLIPWMGDEKLKIDRYDCRGALSDIAPFEASREGYDTMRWLGLNESERKIEQLCDKERYYSLHINEQEEQMYKEEELKRQKANEFQYTYDVPQDPEQDRAPTVAEPDEEDEEFTPPPILDVPVDFTTPKTVKENARIEKTALFVCKQGLQMEILLKAKQADNPQFGFLNQGHPLYKYYRHIVAAIKGGRYQVQPIIKNEEKPEETADSSTNDDHYLHPSLVSTTTQLDVQTSSIPTIPYKPSANCSYSQLVNRIQGNLTDTSQQQQQSHYQYQQQQEINKTTPQQQQQQQQQMSYEQQQQYYQYYYAAQYYEYYKQMAQYQNSGQTGQQTVAPPESTLDPAVQTYLQQMAYAQYMQQQNSNTNPYAQIVSNVNKDVTNPYASLLANIQQNQTDVSTSNEASTSSVTNLTVGNNNNNNNVAVVTVTETKTVISVPKTPLLCGSKNPLLPLAQYGSDSDQSDDDESGSDAHTSDKGAQSAAVEQNETPSTDNVEAREVAIPSGETQIVIDKMASYVAKNGEQFEEIVRAKGDPRFEFLNDSHEFNKYYRSKIGDFKVIETPKTVATTVAPSVVATVTTITTTTAPALETEKREVQLVPKPKERKPIAPVCFSIKKAKDDAPKEIKSALPVEESDEEDGGTPPPAASSSVTVAIEAPSTIEIEATPITQSDNSKNSSNSNSNNSNNNNNNNGIFDGDDPILEMIDLTDDSEERKDARRAEDKIKDKLAAAAREKLASVARDRALQLERKKKAAAFLKLQGSVTTAGPEDARLEPPLTPPIDDAAHSYSPSTPDEKRAPQQKEIVQLIVDDDDFEVEKGAEDKERERDRERGRDRGRGEHRKKSSKKKKSHKRKHSKSKRESKSRKKSKKKRRRSNSDSSVASSRTS